MTHVQGAERRRLIAEDARAGMKMREIVAKYRICYGVVIRACNDHGVVISKSRVAPLSARTYDILADLFRLEASLRTIADKRGISPQQVHQIYVAARDAGIPVPVRRRNGLSSA